MIGDDRKFQLILPSAHADVILESVHNDIGHPGKDRKMLLVRDRSEMDKDVEN